MMTSTVHSAGSKRQKLSSSPSPSTPAAAHSSAQQSAAGAINTTTASGDLMKDAARADDSKANMGCSEGADNNGPLDSNSHPKSNGASRAPTVAHKIAQHQTPLSRRAAQRNGTTTSQSATATATATAPTATAKLQGDDIIDEDDNEDDENNASAASDAKGAGADERRRRAAKSASGNNGANDGVSEAHGNAAAEDGDEEAGGGGAGGAGGAGEEEEEEEKEEDDDDDDEDDEDDDDDEDDEDDEDEDEDDEDENEDGDEDRRVGGGGGGGQRTRRGGGGASGGGGCHTGADIQEQLAAAGPAGVAAAAAIATARKRKRSHAFETNPAVRKRQQTRLIRKLRACIDEYTTRVGQQAVVLITMPGKTVHNYKVFGAQPLESVIRACRQEIMSELEQALLEQAPMQALKQQEDANKHELPPLVIDGIPTPVEKMTQAQLRAFIPLMLKYSTGRGKPGWGKESTKPAWWPNTLPWANVRSDARDESEKQRISWTTTLRQIVTNCYKYHGRDDLLPSFDGEPNDDDDDDDGDNEVGGGGANGSGNGNSGSRGARGERANGASESAATAATTPAKGASGRRPAGELRLGATRLGSASTRHSAQAAAAAAAAQAQAHAAQAQMAQLYTGGGSPGGTTGASGYGSANFLHTISNGDGTVSLIQVDPANAQILTLPDGTQVRAVRLQTLGSAGEHQLIGEPLVASDGSTIELSAHASQADSAAAAAAQMQHQQHQQHQQQQQQPSQQSHEHSATGETHHVIESHQSHQLATIDASSAGDGQIIVTAEDGSLSCYPMSSLVSIPASVYQQFAQAGQSISIVTAESGEQALQAVGVLDGGGGGGSATGVAAAAAADPQQVDESAGAKSEGPSTRSRTAGGGGGGARAGGGSAPTTCSSNGFGADD